MTGYNDKILELTPTWKHTNHIVERIHGNKTLILKAIKDLLDKDYLQFKQVGNRKLYKRNDSGDNEIGFMGIMKNFEEMQKLELDEIKKIPTIGYLTLTQQGKDLLDHVQEQVDRAYIVMVRMNYQAKLRVITQRIADERTKQLENYIDKIMSVLTNEYDHNLIKEYFQNHEKRLDFKI